LTIGKAVLDCNILPFDIAGLVQTPVKRDDGFRQFVARTRVEISDHRHRRLLPMRHERACRRTAEERAYESTVKICRVPAATVKFGRGTLWNALIAPTMTGSRPSEGQISQCLDDLFRVPQVRGRGASACFFYPWMLAIPA